MSWFNEGLSSLKGQITNLTKEIVVPNLLSENTQGEVEEEDHKTQLELLEDKCRSLEQEVEKLKQENSQLRQLEGSLQSSLSSPEVATLDCEVPDDDFDDSFQTIGWGDDVWTDSFLGQEGEEVGEKKTKEVKPEDEITNLQKQVNKLLLDKRKLKQRCAHLDSQVELLSEQLGRTAKLEETSSKHSQLIQTSEDFSSCITSSEFARMQQEFAQLREERAQLRSELTSVTQVVQDLESQVRVSQDENSNLSTGLEELDIQHQEAIEQMMVVKEATQKKYEALLVEFHEIKNKCNELEIINENLCKAKHKAITDENCVQTEDISLTSDFKEGIKNDFEKLLICEIKKNIPTDIPEQFFKKSDSCDSIMTLFNVLIEEYEKNLVEKRKCDTKICDLSSALQDVEDEINGLERENLAAKATIERLTKQSESLRTIPENDEELEALGSKINTLEKEVNVLREVRSNLEVELITARNSVTDLTHRLQTNEAMIRNQDNLQNEFATIQASEQAIRDELNNLIIFKECIEKENLDLKQKLSCEKELKTKLAELQEKYNCEENESIKSKSLLQELEFSNQELKKLKKELLLLNDVCNEKDVKFNELNLIYSNNCKKLASYESKCMELDEIIVSMKIEIESKDRKMCELILEKSTSDKNLEDLKLQYDNVDAKIKNLELLCSSKDSDITNLKLKLEEINKKYSDSVKNANEVSLENSNLKFVTETLDAELKKKSVEIEGLQQSTKHIEENCIVLKNINLEKNNESINLQQTNSELQKEVEELKLALQLVEAEKSMVFDKSFKYDSLQQKCYELENTVEHLKNLLDSLEKEKSLNWEPTVLQKNTEIISLQNKCSDFETTVAKLEGTLKTAELVRNETYEQFNTEKNIEWDNLQQKCYKLETTMSEMEVLLKTSEEEKRLLSEKLKDVLSELDDKSNCLQKVNDQLKVIEELKADLESKCQIFKEERDAMDKQEENFERNKEKHEMALESVSRLSQAIADCEKEKEELKQKCRNLQENLDQQLPKLNDERDQLIQSLQAKHMEGLEYHSEIQRLNKLLSDELSKTTKLTSDVSIINKNCLELRQQIEEKEEALRQQDKEVMNLRQHVETLQNQLEYASQLLRVADRQEAEGQPSVDTSALPPSPVQTEQDKEYIISLERERNELAENLLKEQTRNKYLQNEVQEHHEKEMSLAKEVERLRNHLVSVEDNYTQEMVRAEEQVKELQQRLSQADERVKNSSTAYTSASIRANQQVESLQAQARLLIEQRDKIQSQLSASEDKIQKQAAALTNLQIVLEQFQRDKEKDVALETERIKQILQQANERNETLKDEVKSLQAQLREAKEGLSAAARLGEQLERKDQAMNDLKIEVKELTDKLQKMEEKIKATSIGVEGKVDRYLVKNLLVGYLSAPEQSRMQALRVLATVVDLSHEERQRVGLESASNSEMLQQSLSEAFVRFLENESRPQHPLRLSLAEEPKSRRSSTSVLLPDVLPSIPQFTSGRNSGSILKDVLKDDRL